MNEEKKSWNDNDTGNNNANKRLRSIWCGIQNTYTNTHSKAIHEDRQRNKEIGAVVTAADCESNEWRKNVLPTKMKWECHILFAIDYVVSVCTSMSSSRRYSSGDTRKYSSPNREQHLSLSFAIHRFFFLSFACSLIRSHSHRSLLALVLSPSIRPCFCFLFSIWYYVSRIHCFAVTWVHLQQRRCRRQPPEDVLVSLSCVAYGIAYKSFNYHCQADLRIALLLHIRFECLKWLKTFDTNEFFGQLKLQWRRWCQYQYRRSYHTCWRSQCGRTERQVRLNCRECARIQNRKRRTCGLKSISMNETETRFDGKRSVKLHLQLNINVVVIALQSLPTWKISKPKNQRKLFSLFHFTFIPPSHRIFCRWHLFFDILRRQTTKRQNSVKVLPIIFSVVSVDRIHCRRSLSNCSSNFQLKRAKEKARKTKKIFLPSTSIYWLLRSISYNVATSLLLCAIPLSAVAFSSDRIIK